MRCVRVADDLTEVSTARTAYARVITQTWRKIAADIVGVGRCLIEAKAELPHGEWLLLVEHDLPFSARTAQRLMKIAADPLLSNASHASHLPASVMTLHELATLPKPTLEKALVDGTVRPDMSRREATRLREKRPPDAVREARTGESPQRKSTATRHPINYRKRRVNAERVVSVSISALEGICLGFEGLDDLSSVDEASAKASAKTIGELAAQIRRFARRLRSRRAATDPKFEEMPAQPAANPNLFKRPPNNDWQKHISNAIETVGTMAELIEGYLSKVTPDLERAEEWAADMRKHRTVLSRFVKTCEGKRSLRRIEEPLTP